MIARLDDAFQNSKRFVADASHELRTPLTILRGELENLAEDAAPGLRIARPRRQPAGGSRASEQNRGAIVHALAARRRRGANRMDAFRSDRTGQNHRRTNEPAGRGQGHFHCLRRQPAGAGGRQPGAAQTGGRQPARQCHQIHAGKGRDPTARRTPSTATPCWKWRTTASAFRRMRCRTSSSVFIAWTRPVPAIPKAPGSDFPSSNPFAPRTARKWKRKAPSASGSRFRVKLPLSNN